MSQKKSDYRFLLIVLWMTFTLALTVWIVVFNYTLFEKMSALEIESAQDIARQQKMVLMESTSLLIALFLGGVALLYFLKKEKRTFSELRGFFAAFTHEVKTSIASLRLQAESLKEDIQDPSHQKLLNRLANDTVRLSLQLENSLFLARENQADYLIRENVDLQKLMKSVMIDWPDLKLQFEQNATLFGDLRSLESVFKNLVQNAKVHGESNQIQIRLKELAINQIEIEFRDNGNNLFRTWSKR